MGRLRIVCVWFTMVVLAGTARGEFRAGAAITDITPRHLPVLVNGGMLSRSVDSVNTKVHARSIAFTDGSDTVVVVVVDSCMMPRPLLDRAKQIASQKTGIPREHMLISATHTHSAPSCMGALGTDADPGYTLFLTKRLVDAILAPLENMQPARVGFGEIDASEYTALRRWVIRPDKMVEDPFGNFTVRANMHAGNHWENVIGETGPEDPALVLLSFEHSDGRPLAVLANFSMHYFGDRALGADYFGLFSDGLHKRVAEDNPEFVGVMSHGCSGDIWRRDYTQEPGDRNDKLSIEEYTSQMLDLAEKAYRDIEYSEPESVAMEEVRMTLDYRVPDLQRLQWAEKVVADMETDAPRSKREVYAREQIILHERKNTEIVVQALRIGDDIGIATTPNETYAITGLKIKNASPLAHTMVIELANGGDGYIPPPEQHLLGGYNTWAARSAGLEVLAEPKISETAIQLLENVSGRTRTDRRPPPGKGVKTIRQLRPLAYWRLDEFSGPRAIDSSGNHFDAIYEPQVLFFLEGPRHDIFTLPPHMNRAAHFAGNRLQARVPGLGDEYSVSLWFWNGMPNSAREETGWIYSRGRNHVLGDQGEHIGIGGTSGNAGNLVFWLGKNPVGEGGVIDRWTWNHLGFVRNGSATWLYLNGKLQQVLHSDAELPANLEDLYFGGRSDNRNNFEGRLDEIAVFDRALTEKEIVSLSR